MDGYELALEASSVTGKFVKRGGSQESHKRE